MRVGNDDGVASCQQGNAVNFRGFYLHIQTFISSQEGVLSAAQHFMSVQAGQYISCDEDVQFCSEQLASTPPSGRDPGSESQTPSTTGSGKTKKRLPRKCAKCRNHHQDELWRGHKRFCPWADCYCKLCILVDQRRDNTKKGAKLRREQMEDEQRGQSDENESPPGSSAVCRLDEHRLEETLSKILRLTPVRSSSVLFLALLRSCAMDISQAVATISYAFEEMKEVAPSLTVPDFTSRYAVFPKSADISMFRPALSSIMTPGLAQNNMTPMTHTTLNLSYPRYTGALYNMHLPVDVAGDENGLQRFGSDMNQMAPPNIALVMNREQQTAPGGNFGYMPPLIDQDFYARGPYYTDNGDAVTPPSE